MRGQILKKGNFRVILNIKLTFISCAQKIINHVYYTYNETNTQVLQICCSGHFLHAVVFIAIKRFKVLVCRLFGFSSLNARNMVVYLISLEDVNHE